MTREWESTSLLSYFKANPTKPKKYFLEKIIYRTYRNAYHSSNILMLCRRIISLELFLVSMNVDFGDITYQLQLKE